MSKSQEYLAEEFQERFGHEWLSDELHHAILKTWLRLPADVRDFVLDKCTFIFFAKGLHGMTFPASAFTHMTKSFRRTMRDHWVILLEDGGNHLEFTIPHEIAHAYGGRIKGIQTNNRFEEELTDELVAEWGFKIPKHRFAIHRMHRETETGTLLPSLAEVRQTMKATKKGGKK